MRIINRASYTEISKTLTECLHLRQPPVAICLTDTVPSGVEGPASRAPAGCLFWQDGTKRVLATTADDHSMCAVGVYTHHLESSGDQQIDLADALTVFSELGYVRAEDVPLIPTLSSQPRYVIYAPLADTPLAPDVVILFVNANQSLILSEAAQQVEGQATIAMGRPACAVIPQVKNTGRAALSLGCCGARSYLDILTEDMSIFAIPGSTLGNYVERIEVLANANVSLSKFHQIRRRDIEAGLKPTIKASLEAFGA